MTKQHVVELVGEPTLICSTCDHRLADHWLEGPTGKQICDGMFGSIVGGRCQCTSFNDSEFIREGRFVLLEEIE